MPRKRGTLDDVWVVLPSHDVLQLDARRKALNRRAHFHQLVPSRLSGLSDEGIQQERGEIISAFLSAFRKTTNACLIPSLEFLEHRRPLKPPFWFARGSDATFRAIPSQDDALRQAQQEVGEDWDKLSPRQQQNMQDSFQERSCFDWGGAWELKWPFSILHEVSCERDALAVEDAVSERLPLPLSARAKDPWYLFGTQLWELTREDRVADTEELRLLFLDAIDKERRKFERLHRKFAGEAGNPVYEREPISEDVQMFVWRRDGGKCVRCGSQERLEFDHMIPVSKGGSNTARNIQLLCERCNRKKGDDI